VTDRRESVLVNVGTGAQVAVFTDSGAGILPASPSQHLKPNRLVENPPHDFEPPVELRPFPCGGNLLSNVGLAGGWSYQVLEQFFRDVGRYAFDVESPAPLYEVMNRLAADVPPGAEGLRCDPLFSGTRLDPTVRGSITGLSPHNFTTRYLARAVLEGMARSLHDGYAAIQRITGLSQTKLIAAGNGLRENPLLANIVSQSFGLPINFTEHREEAAYGAALIAGQSFAPRKDNSPNRLALDDRQR
jgi:sugar (pentulose or hexulose) kinase